MDIEMIRADVQWSASHRRLEGPDYLCRTLHRFAGDVIERPRMQIHCAFGEQRGDIVVIWVRVQDAAHSPAIGLVERVQIRFRRYRVASCGGVDERALLGRGVRPNKFLRVCDGCDRGLFAGCVDGNVDIATVRHRDAPPRHRKTRIG